MTNRKLLTTLMVITLFSGAFSFSMKMDIYYFYFIFSFFIITCLKLKFPLSINKGFFVLFLYYIITSIIGIILYSSLPELLLKQIFGIAFSSLSYYLLIKVNNYNVEKLFVLYIKIAFIVSVLGLFQQLSFLLHIRPGYDWTYFVPRAGNLSQTLIFLRIYSIMPEPSVLAIILTPAMFVALNNISSKSTIYISRFRSQIIFSAYFLTFSSVAFVGLILASIILLYRKNLLNINSRKIVYLPILLIILSSLFFGLYQSIPDYKHRIDAVVAVLSDPASRDLILSGPMRKNASVFILFTNVNVALDSLRINPFFGLGLGSHPKHFNSFYSEMRAAADAEVNRLLWGMGFSVSSEDANSLFVRLLSETGLVGVIIFLWVLKKYFIKKSKIQDISSNFSAYKLSIINNSIFLFILLRLMRFGHYFLDGFFFFAFIYYFSNKQYKAEQLQERVVKAQ